MRTMLRTMSVFFDWLGRHGPDAASRCCSCFLRACSASAEDERRGMGEQVNAGATV